MRGLDQQPIWERAILLVCGIIFMVVVVVVLALYFGGFATLITAPGRQIIIDEKHERDRVRQREALHEKLIKDCADRRGNPITENGLFLRCDPL